MPDLGCRGSRGDRVPEQVPGDVLAVVLTTAPFVWAVRSFCCAATPSPDRPGPNTPLDCSLGRGDPSLLVPSRSSPRDPRAVGVKARRSFEIETRQKPNDPPRLRPEPRPLQRDRAGRGIAWPDVVPTIPLPGDHRAVPGVGECHEHPDGAAVEASRPCRGAGAEGSCLPPDLRRRERARSRHTEVRSRQRGLDRGRRLLGRARNRGGDEDHCGDRDDAPLHTPDASLCALRRGSSVGRAHD